MSLSLGCVLALPGCTSYAAGGVSARRSQVPVVPVREREVWFRDAWVRRANAGVAIEKTLGEITGGGVRVGAAYDGDRQRTAETLRRVCPGVAGFGELDRSFAVQGQRLAEHLEELGVPHDVKIYPGVGHSYMNDFGDGVKSKLMRSTPMRAGYNEEASEDSWRRMLAFFEEHL